MKRFYFILLVLISYSCDYFNVKKTSSEAILKEELQTFNWDDVDNYPSFSTCDSLTSKAEQESCFETTLTNTITRHLQHQIIVVTKDVNDTLKLKLEISNQGKVEIKAITMDSLTQQQIPELETLILESMDDLPTVFPALKRGQHVTTTFELPLIVKVD
jgi:hypothetical protein